MFGLNSDLPSGCQTIEVVEDVPTVDDDYSRGLGEIEGGDNGLEGNGGGSREENVLYVQLPEGHPIITRASSTSSTGEASPNSANVKSPNEAESKDSSPENPVPAVVKPSLSFEEAVEQAEVIFDDGDLNASLDSHKEADGEVEVSEAPATVTTASGGKDVIVSGVGREATEKEEETFCQPIAVQVEEEEQVTSSSTVLTRQTRGKLSSPSLTKRTSPRISPRTQSRQREAAAAAAAAAAAVTSSEGTEQSLPKSKVSSPASKSVSSVGSDSVDGKKEPLVTTLHRHNLRPKRSLRHVSALKQQAKRRKRNTSLAAAAVAAASGGTSGAAVSAAGVPTATTQRAMSTRRSSIALNGGKTACVGQ